MKTPSWLCFSIGFLFVGPLLADEEQVQPVRPTLSWMSDLDEALAVSKESGKPILLEFR